MLFFKDIKEEFLENPAFKAFYEQECHICATTMALVSALEQRTDQGSAILEQLGISPDAHKALAQGDHCDPATVARLAKALGINTQGMFDNCPRHPSG